MYWFWKPHKGTVYVMTQFVNGVTYILQQYSTCSENHTRAQYSGPCDLRPPIQPAKYGLKLKVVLK